MATLANLATLIARYSVLENVYQQWQEMSLEKEYENSLIALAILVLQLLAAIESGTDAGWGRTRSLL